MSIEKRTTIITGATGGLGSVTSRILGDLGVNLALLDRNPDKLTALTKSLSLPKNRIFTVALDLLNPAEAKTAAEAVAAKFGRIDILIHLVGGWIGGRSILETSPDDLSFMLNQHVWTSFNIAQAFVPHLVKNGWGRIIMITSPFAARPTAKGGPYAIGKMGQEALMLTLSQELKGTGITTNLLQVKTIDTEHKKVSAPTSDNASWTTPEELASAIVYLLSDEASNINGAKIPFYGSY